MLEKPQEHPELPIPPKFKTHSAVFKMVVVSIAALGLPLAVMLYGGWGLWQGREVAVNHGDATANKQSLSPAFRMALESVANENLPDPNLEPWTRRFVFEKSEKYDETEAGVRAILDSPDTVVISTDDNQTRWLVRVPSLAAHAFDAKLAALEPIQLPCYPIADRTDRFVFYEINLTRPR